MGARRIERREVMAHGTKEAPAPAAAEGRQIQEAPVAALALAGLSARERQVVLARARGLFAKEIAFEIGISEATVRVFLHRSYKKLRGLAIGQRAGRFPPGGGAGLWIRASRKQPGR